MENLRKQLNQECDYQMKEETMDRFLELMTEVELDDSQVLIPYGKFDRNIYIVKSGLIRVAYFDGLNEKTYGFGAPGSMLISYHCYYRRQPSFLQFEACGKSVIMKIPKASFDEFIEQSGDFAKWMLKLYTATEFQNELKLSVLNGTAKERFESLAKNRPEIIENVQQKIIASYIGITPSYLCRLTKQYRNNLGKGTENQEK